MSTAPPLVSGAKPGLGHVLEFLRDPIALLQRGHSEHGDLFSLRLGNRDGVVMVGPEHQRFFYTQPESVLSIKSAYPYLEAMFDEGFYYFAGEEEYHKQQEVVVSRVQSLLHDDYVGIMADETLAFLATLSDEGEFDLNARLAPLVMRIAAHTFLGRDLGLLLGYDFFGELRRLADGMEPVLPIWLPIPRLVRARRARNRLHKRLAGLLDARRQKPVDPPDFLQTLVDARYRDGSAVPDSVVVNLVLLVMYAGQETITGHLSWAIIDLLQNPEYLKEVVDEQHDLYAGNRDLSIERLARLRRLDRALLETQRLHPVAYIGQRTAVETLDYRGYTIPEGTMLFVAGCVSHRLPELFDDPDQYLPDRFTEGHDHDSYRLIGFGGGHHRCPGVDFAHLEMKVVLSLLLQHLDLELVDTDPRPDPGPKIKWPESPWRVRDRRRAGPSWGEGQ
jgi:sterol 14-demethylase